MKPSVLLVGVCLLACGGANPPSAQPAPDLFVLEQGPGEAKQAFVPTGLLPACLEAIRMHGHDLPPAVYAAAKRRPR